MTCKKIADWRTSDHVTKYMYPDLLLDTDKQETWF